MYTDGARAFFFFTGVDDLRVCAGLAVWVLGGRAGGGDFARMVLGCEPVLDVMSVLSQSPSLILERDAARGPPCMVMRVPESTLCRMGSSSSACFRRMLLALAVFRRSAAVVAVRGGLGGARGGVGATRLGGCGVTRGSSSSFCGSTSVASGVMLGSRRAVSSRGEYRLSFACVLDSVGYDRLLLEAFAEPNDPLRFISGTTAIFCDCDDDDVRMRSVDGRWRGRSSSLSSSLEAEERVLRVLELL